MKRSWLGVLALVLVLGTAPARAQEIDIPFDESRPFERTSTNENIQDTLRVLLQQSGVNVIFRPGVDGLWNGSFTGVSPRAAFQRLIQEQDLVWTYDDQTRTVTIGTAADQDVRQFRTLQNVGAEEFRAAVRRFNLPGEVVIDDPSGTVLISGRRDDVQTLAQLLERLEAAYASRRTAQIEQMQFTAVEAEDFRAQEIRVIQLKYANVGPTTTVINNQTVTLPGIDETLATLLGVDDGTVGILEQGATDPLLTELGFTSVGASSIPRISIDRRTNSIVVRGDPAAVDRVAQLVAELDRPIPMIEIEVMIVQAVDGVSESLGIDWATQYDTTARSFALNTGLGEAQATVAARNALGLVSPFDPLTSSVIGGFVFDNGAFSLRARLNALERESRVQTIAAPRVVTLNAVPARIANSSSAFFPVVQGDTADLEEVQTGVILQITPSLIPRDVDEQQLVRMNIAATNNAPDVQATGASAISVSGNEVSTDLIIPEGATFVLGGLFGDTRQDVDDGIPLLKDVPLLGLLFGNRATVNNFNETLFFITPRVVDPDRILPEDVAARRYMQMRQARLRNTQRLLQETAQDSDSPALRFLEEAE